MDIFNQIFSLFQIDKSVIYSHLRNIFKQEELNKESTVTKFAIIQIERNHHKDNINY
ncbi:hypothetical protein NOVO_00600 [Rickettsiales bacterium Ac37b]|nr:hypothetical protein NOVO_00600 [Rickettsiales bacterium Ac37b]